MGVHVKELKGDGAWWVVIYHGGRRVVQRVGSREDAEARAAGVRLEMGIRAGGTASPRETVGEALQRWISVDSATLSASWRYVAESEINRHLRPAFGSRLLVSVTADDVREYCSEKLASGLAASSVARHVSLLGRVYSIAAERHNGLLSPTRGVSRWVSRAGGNRGESVEDVSAWTRDEVAALLGQARAHESRFAPMLAFYFGTGCRRGEGLALRWADVDFARGEVVIRRSRTRGREGAPKSRKARRVTVPEPLIAELRSQLATVQSEALAAGRAVSEYVFPNTLGDPQDERNLSRDWYRVRGRARLASGAPVRPLPLHSTRHTYASLALDAGMPIPWVAAQLGHSSPAVTMRVYAHSIRTTAPSLDWLALESGEAGQQRTRPHQERRKQ